MCGAKSAWLPSMCGAKSALLPFKCRTNLHIEVSHVDFCPHMERRQSFMDQKKLKLPFLPLIKNNLFKQPFFIFSRLGGSQGLLYKQSHN